MDDSKTNENKTKKNGLFKNKYFVLFLILVLVAVLLLAKLRSSPKRILWSEGKAIAGVMARILEEYASVKKENGHYPPSWEDLESFVAAEKPNGRIDALIPESRGNFRKEHFKWEVNYNPNKVPPVEFKIMITSPPGCGKPDALMLNEKWEWFHLDDDGKWIPDAKPVPM